MVHTYANVCKNARNTVSLLGASLNVTCSVPPISFNYTMLRFSQNMLKVWTCSATPTQSQIVIAFVKVLVKHYKKFKHQNSCNLTNCILQFNIVIAN